MNNGTFTPSTGLLWRPTSSTAAGPQTVRFPLRRNPPPGT